MKVLEAQNNLGSVEFGDTSIQSTMLLDEPEQLSTIDVFHHDED